PEQDVYIAWTDNKFGGGMLFDDVMFRKSTDDGLTWGVEQRLTPDSRCDAGGALDMVSQDSMIFIVWDYNGTGNPAPCSLFFLASTDCGETWRERETVKSGFAIGIRDANVAVFQNYVYVVWRDNQYTYYEELYIRRGSLTPPGIEERASVSVSSLKVFPNPFTTSITIALPSIGHRAKGIELQMYNVSGKEVMSYDLRKRVKGISIDTKSLPGGIYFIKVMAGDVFSIKKVIKIK
ncbi:MAG TPA: hypothetical protein DEQ09_08785, partial [Bacteroidales bacterium]|nr:hypothetical protein [Bacteroidales bacterium]